MVEWFIEVGPTWESKKKLVAKDVVQINPGIHGNQKRREIKLME